ncbi:MAG TPA: hypothetical protein VFG52_12085, partial [Xanthomonadales bacterium]|nr:hypothetical protein [Xanthomonadales bacterium]
MSNLRMFAWLTPALLCAGLLLSGTAQAQQSSTSPYDGMSAIDIMVAAAARKSGSASQPDVPAGTQVATAGSTISFHRFDLVELTGRFQHEGWYPIPGDPLPGTATGLAQMVGTWQSIQFRLVSEANELIHEVALT